MPSLETQLNSHPVLKEALVWQSANGDVTSYDGWPRDKKSRISEIYDKLCRGETNLGLNLPTEQNVNPNGFAYFTADQAFDVYAAHAAHCLHVEFERLVPWPLVSRPPAELAVLFSSASYHSIILPSERTDYPDIIQAGRDFQETPENEQLGELNGDPRVGYDFLSGRTSPRRQNLIGENELQTLANLTIWMRDNVGHGHIPREDTRYFRWLENRLRPARGTSVALANVGCHSASKLMVDLARSVNIPLLHVRSQESNSTDGHFFNRTHGGLIYGWGAHFPQLLPSIPPHILWHTDEIYALTGEPSFPIDSSGNLLPEPAATQACFEARWRTPAQLAQAGFNYNLQKVYPEQGFGMNSRHQYEDRTDYGMMSGYWTKEGSSNLPDLMRLEEHYEICGAFLLDLYCRNSLQAQLNYNIPHDEAGLSPAHIPPMHTIQEYYNRAQMGVAALGGCAAFNETMANWNANRGSNLLRQMTRHVPVKRKRVMKSKTPPIKTRKTGLRTTKSTRPIKPK